MKRPIVSTCSFLAASLVVLACVPDLADDRARIASPRILAVRAVPAEAKAGQPVTLTALVASPSGSREAGDDLEWAMCLARKPLTELGPVAQECIDRFGTGGDIFQRLGRGQTVTGVLPTDVCRRFGPIAPPATAGGVAGRPVDPDPSGGYYQPIVLGGELGAALGSVRLACGVVGVPSSEAVRYNQGSRPNENPEIERLEIVADGVRSVAPGTESPGASVVAGSRVSLRAAWAACPREPSCGDGMCTAGENQSTCAVDCRDAPKGCPGAESYLWPNPETRIVETRREGITVSWFSDRGGFANAQTGRTEADADGVDTSNVWTAPAERAPVRLWIVLRDDRGGVSWGEYLVQVE